MLNEDARSRWLGKDNVGMSVLLDMGASVNMITPECVVALGLQMGPLTDLCEGGYNHRTTLQLQGKANRIHHHEHADQQDIRLQ